MENFSDMPSNARVWVYQANKELNDTDINCIKEIGTTFVKNWAAHGRPLKAVLEVLYKRFVVLMADEQQAKASGCSIDDSVHMIKEIERVLDVDFFNRLLVCYKEDEHIRFFHLEDTDELLKETVINADTLVFNNTVSTKEQFDTEWIVPLKNTWLSKYLPVPAKHITL